MPRRKTTQREKALEVIIKLQTGHGPFFAELYQLPGGKRWQRNSYSGCRCIYICKHCLHEVIFCKKHGHPTALAHMQMGGKRPLDVPDTTWNTRWKLGARWPS